MQHLKHHLERLAMSDWWIILSQWLPNNDGWLSIMEALSESDCTIDDDPAEEISELLQQYPLHSLIDDIQFATEISRLQFLCRRARLTKSGKRWSSFQEPFTTFAALEPEEVPHVFEHAPNCESVTKYWLLGKLYELQSERIQGSRPIGNGKHTHSRP